jgi:Uma2 family endonuclease
MTAKPLKKHATYDDLRDVPDNFVAEMFDGELYATPRPLLSHANAASGLLHTIRGSFHHKGPDGWIILIEPELHFQNDVLVPDIAGWRRARLPEIPPDAPYATLAPDWICEVLSARTEKLDRGKKLRIYAREGVAHAWLLDPRRRTLEVMSLEAGRWTALGAYGGEAALRAVPFESIELELGVLWS